MPRQHFFLIWWPTDRQTDRPTDRQTHRQTDRQTDWPTDRQTDWPTDRQTDRQTHRQTTDRQTDQQTDRQTDWPTDRQTDRLTNRQTDRQTKRQTDRQTDWQADGQTDRPTDRQTDERQTDITRYRAAQKQLKLAPDISIFCLLQKTVKPPAYGFTNMSLLIKTINLMYMQKGDTLTVRKRLICSLYAVLRFQVIRQIRTLPLIKVKFFNSLTLTSLALKVKGHMTFHSRNVLGLKKQEFTDTRKQGEFCNKMVVLCVCVGGGGRT